MIKKFNIFEAINSGKPKKGDYTIIKLFNDIVPTIGKITYINRNSTFPYLIEFDDDFNYYEYGLEDNNIAFEDEEIIYWSKDKKELETILQGNKYNL